MTGRRNDHYTIEPYMKLMIRLELTTDYLQGSCTTIVLHQQRDDNRSCTYSVSNMGDLQSPALATRHTYRYKRFRRDLNPQSPDRQSDALTIMLRNHKNKL